MSGSRVVLVGGSRRLSPAGLGVVRVVASLLACSGSSFVLGCASGADAAFLSALVLLFGVQPRRVQVFAAAPFANFKGDGADRVAVQLGVRVVWGAGGGVSVPVRARLAKRSAAAASFASFGVFVVESPSSKGSLRTASILARSGCPVRFFCVGFEGAPDIPPDRKGEWVSIGSVGSASAWAWKDAQMLFGMDTL